MKIFDVPSDDGGTPVAFEVPNLFITRWGLKRIVQSIPAARVLRVGPNELFRDDGERLAFEVDDVAFTIQEPFADNSRLWIGPYPVRHVPQLAAVRAAFARSTIWTRIRGAAS